MFSEPSSRASSAPGSNRRKDSFTHTNIVRFVLLALELDIDIINRINSNTPTIPHIIDPSCGSGTFLIEAMKLITSSVLHPRPDYPP